MLLKHRFLLIMSAVFSYAMPLSLSAALPVVPTPVLTVTGSSGGIAAWYQARQQHINSAQQDLNRLLARANSGDTNAQYELGLLYQSGRGVTQDSALAQRWFNTAAQGGHIAAMYALALLLREQGGQGSLQHSVLMQEKAALAGHPTAQYGLGMLYANGQYVPRDLHKARHWLQQAQQRGNTMAQLALRELPAQPVALPQPARALAPRANTANPRPPVRRSQSTVARANVTPTNGAQVGRNAADSQAAASAPDLAALGGLSTEQLLKVARQGDKYAQLMLGALYEDGKGGFEQNHEQAMSWYLKSARQGYPKAQHNLALLYEDGLGVERDYKQAAIWYAKAARAGFSESKNNLAVLHILGRGVKQDRAYAEQLLHQAVAEGNIKARRNLKMLLDGAG